jgi:hypothetical protein
MSSQYTCLYIWTHIQGRYTDTHQTIAYLFLFVVLKLIPVAFLLYRVAAVPVCLWAWCFVLYQENEKMKITMKMMMVFTTIRTFQYDKHPKKRRRNIVVCE